METLFLSIIMVTAAGMVLCSFGMLFEFYWPSIKAFLGKSSRKIGGIMVPHYKMIGIVKVRLHGGPHDGQSPFCLKSQLELVFPTHYKAGNDLYHEYKRSGEDSDLFVYNGVKDASKVANETEPLPGL